MSGAAEQGDEADEAFGGTRLVTNDSLDGGAASCAPALRAGAHRLAAYRRCSVGAWALEQRNGLSAGPDELVWPTRPRSRLARRRRFPPSGSAAQRGRLSRLDTREAFGIETGGARKAPAGFPCLSRRTAGARGSAAWDGRQHRVTFTGGHGLEYAPQGGVGCDHGATNACATEQGDEADEAR